MVYCTSNLCRIPVFINAGMGSLKGHCHGDSKVFDEMCAIIHLFIHKLYLRKITMQRRSQHVKKKKEKKLLCKRWFGIDPL